jgi:hypothetical protein
MSCKHHSLKRPHLSRTYLHTKILRGETKYHHCRLVLPCAFFYLCVTAGVTFFVSDHWSHSSRNQYFWEYSLKTTCYPSFCDLLIFFAHTLFTLHFIHLIELPRLHIHTCVLALVCQEEPPPPRPPPPLPPRFPPVFGDLEYLADLHIPAENPRQRSGRC